MANNTPIGSINYAEKYEKRIAERFAQASLTESDCGHDFEWAGAKTIKVASVETVPETQYTRSGENRFGTVYDVGDELQEMTCTQEPAFSFTIDALDGSDQAIEKSAAGALDRQLREVTVPGMDRHRLKKWALGANVQMISASKPTDKTLGKLIVGLGSEMSDRLVPLDNRTLYITNEMYTILKTSPDWIAVDALGEEALKKGYIGEYDGNKVKRIPTKWMPAGVYFFIKRKGTTVDPVKMKKYDILPKVQGYSGPVVQGVTYYDSFVLGAKGDGIGVCASSEVILAKPALSHTGSHQITVGPVSHVVFMYTTDGTNPRYSESAKVYTEPVTLTPGQTIRVVGTKAGCVGQEDTMDYQ